MGAWLLGVPTFLIAIFSIVESYWVVWVFGISVNVMIVASYFIRLLILRLMPESRSKVALLN